MTIKVQIRLVFISIVLVVIAICGMFWFESNMLIQPFREFKEQPLATRKLVALIKEDLLSIESDLLRLKQDVEMDKSFICQNIETKAIRATQNCLSIHAVNDNQAKQVNVLKQNFLAYLKHVYFTTNQIKRKTIFNKYKNEVTDNHLIADISVVLLNLNDIDQAAANESERLIENAENRMIKISHALVFTVIVLAIFIFFIGLITIRNVLRPLKKITGSLEDGNAGELYKKVDYHKNNEYGRISKALNGMYDRLKMQLETIQFENANLDLQVKEKTKALTEQLNEKTIIEKELMATNARLNESKLAVMNILEDYKIELEEKRKAQLALAESEVKFREVFMNSLDANFIVDLTNDTLVLINKAFEDIVRSTADNILGKTALELGLYPDLEVFEKLKAEVISKGSLKDIELVLCRMDGTMSPVLMSWSITNIEGHPFLIGVARDFAEQRNLLNSLTASNEFNEGLLKTIPFGIDIVDQQGRILFMNALMQDQFPDAKGNYCYTTYCDLKTQCQACPLKKGIEVGISGVIEIDQVMGEKVFQVTHSGIRFNGHPAMLEIFQDITERKRTETEKSVMMEDLFKRNRDLEQFTYIISHNLRAPVANIKGSCAILTDEEAPEEVKENVLKGLVQAVNKLDEVIYDMNLILSSHSTLKEQREWVNLEELIKEATDNFIKDIQNKHIVVQTSIEVKALFSIKSYLYSIFYNLISNSIKYSNPLVQAPYIKITSTRVGNQIIIQHIDNGQGIDLTRFGDQVFGLYKRFNQQIEGKGMGLYMVKTQVESIGGSISLESEPGKGSTFTIRLPFINPV